MSHDRYSARVGEDLRVGEEGRPPVVVLALLVTRSRHPHGYSGQLAAIKGRLARVDREEAIAVIQKRLDQGNRSVS
jgi:hypothetical protein